MINAPDQRNMTRVYFNLDFTDWHGRPNEGLWAEPIGGKFPAVAFRLWNSPFFATGVSFLDVVRAALSVDGARMEFTEVVDRGGHSTYMLLVPPGSRDFVTKWARLEGLGCSYESKSIHLSIGDRTLYSVDVPSSSDIYHVYSVLEEGERDGTWLFQKGHCGHDLTRGQRM